MAHRVWFQNTIDLSRRETGVDLMLAPSAGRCVVGLSAALTAFFSHPQTRICGERCAVRQRRESGRAEITPPDGSSN